MSIPVYSFIDVCIYTFHPEAQNPQNPVPLEACFPARFVGDRKPQSASSEWITPEKSDGIPRNCCTHPGRNFGDGGEHENSRDNKKRVVFETAFFGGGTLKKVRGT